MKLWLIFIIGLVTFSVIGSENLKQNSKKEAATMFKFVSYTPKNNLKPVGLMGISDAQVEDHWKLYVGYVDQVNKLNTELGELFKNGKSASLTYADRRRRYGFEYNGMILHEYYFGNLKSGVALQEGDFKDAITNTWGSFEAWQDDFTNTGKSRSIGWAILYLDPATGQLTNHFIMEHEIGTIAGFAPILVMDVWEHAYMVDHKAVGRADYIKTFLSNINWDVVASRYDSAKHGTLQSRFTP